MKKNHLEPWIASAGNKPWYLSPYFILTLTLMLVATWALENDTQPVLSGLSAIATMAYLCVTLATVFIHVIIAQRVDANMIFGSVAVYLLMGIIMALMLLFLHNTNPGSVLGSLNNADPWGGGSDNFAVLLYFSMITLTSVGYGDMVPVGSAAKSLAMFTGVFGQLCVAILVAKLVGVHTAQVMGRKSS